MKRRGGYEILASIPFMMEKKEKQIFHSTCKKLKIKTVDEKDEDSRINALRQKEFDVMVV